MTSSVTGLTSVSFFFPGAVFACSYCLRFALSYNTHSLTLWLKSAHGNLTIEATDGTPLVSRMNSM